LPLQNPASGSSPVLQLSFAKSHLLIQFFLKPEIFSDSSPVCDGKIPFIQRFSLSGANSHSDRQVGFAVTSFKFQIEITCPLLPLISFLKKITAHLPVSRAKGIQTLRIHISVQKERYYTLHRYRFSRTVRSPKKHSSFCKRKLLLVIIPEINQSDLIGLPSTAHLYFLLYNPPGIFPVFFPLPDR